VCSKAKIHLIRHFFFLFIKNLYIMNLCTLLILYKIHKLAT